MAELKPPTTYDEQLNILKQRGVHFENTDKCCSILSSVSYYRLTAYLLPFKSKTGNYGGVSFERVYRIYEFDRKLRRILFSAIEEIEVFLRAQLAYFHAHKYGAEGYTVPANFSKAHNSDKFNANLQREINNNRTVLFVKHHIEQYDSHFPIWVIIELFSFGMLSRFYSDLQLCDRKSLAKEIYQSIPKNVQSWLRCCTDLRNICAHYGRLYYRIFPAYPAGFDVTPAQRCRLWGAVLSVRALYPDAQKWNGEVLPALEAVFEEYKDAIDLYHMSFPKDWVRQLKK